MQAKDLGIVMETAREYRIPLPSAAVHAQLYQAMLEMDMPDLDNSAVIGVLEILAGEKLLDNAESLPAEQQGSQAGPGA
jgi:2-hydroxy-3-oxopropionate reductase